VQGLFAFQIQGRRGSEAAEVNLSLLHGHHPESDHRVSGHGVTGTMSWEEPLVLNTKQRPNLPRGLGEIPEKSPRNPTTPTCKKKTTRGWDYDSTAPGRRMRKAMRMRNCGRLQVGGGGPDTIGWASMPSLIWTSPSVSTSLRDNEDENNQEITIIGVGAVE